MSDDNKTTDRQTCRDERSGANRCWIYRDGYHYAQVTFSKPDSRLYPTAVEYMRVMPWREIEKLAASEGIEPDRYITVMHARCEMQRREIARLHGLLRKKASDEAPSFSPNFDERNGL